MAPYLSFGSLSLERILDAVNVDGVFVSQIIEQVVRSHCSRTCIYTHTYIHSQHTYIHTYMEH